MKYQDEKENLNIFLVLSISLSQVSFSLCNSILSRWSRKKRIIVLKWCRTKVKPCEKFRNVYVV